MQSEVSCKHPEVSLLPLTTTFPSYFQAASPTSIERNIYTITIPVDPHAVAVSKPTALTDTSSRSYHRASFSPEAGFYLLSYEGPNVPWQKIVTVGQKGGPFLALVEFLWLTEYGSRLGGLFPYGQCRTEQYTSAV